jgi:folate-binding protein YgfZ
MEATLQALHAAHHAVLRDVAGQPVPLGYGDFDAEAGAVESGAGVMDWSACGIIGVRGPDAAQFLNGVTTNNIKALPKGWAQDNLLCANKGKILHAVLVVHTKEDEFLVITEPGETGAVARHLESYHVREDLVMGVAGLSRVDVLGPEAPAVLRGLGIAAGAAGSFRAQQRDGLPVLALHLPLGNLPRYALLLPPAAAPALVEALLHAPHARLVGQEAWEEARIWAGVPRFGADFGPDHLPAEAGIYTHIAFDKGCYVGQEIHARMHYRGHPNRKLVAVILPDAAAAGLRAGSDLFQAGRPGGQLTSLSRRAREGLRAGIALVRYPLAAERTPLAVSADGPSLVTLRPVATDLGTARP